MVRPVKRAHHQRRVIPIVIASSSSWAWSSRSLDPDGRQADLDEGDSVLHPLDPPGQELPARAVLIRRRRKLALRGCDLGRQLVQAAWHRSGSYQCGRGRALHARPVVDSRAANLGYASGSGLGPYVAEMRLAERAAVRGAFVCIAGYVGWMWWLGEDGSHRNSDLRWHRPRQTRTGCLSSPWPSSRTPMTPTSASPRPHRPSQPA